MTYNSKRWLAILSITLLISILLFLSAQLVNKYLGLQRMGIISTRRPLITHSQKRLPLNGTDVGIVQPWMTFEYINYLFGLPPEYLKTGLGVTDVRYPRISIRSYARSQKTDVNTIVSDVQKAISIYFPTTAR